MCIPSPASTLAGGGRLSYPRSKSFAVAWAVAPPNMPRVVGGFFMSLSDLASIGSLVSGLAVLVSLIYLGLQTHQNAKHSRALIQQGRAARVADTALRIAELRDSDGIDKCFTGARDVSPKDLARFINICRAIFMSAE